MCALTVSDFDALDVLDADSVLIAGEIQASERRVERLQHSQFPFTKNAFSIIGRTVSGEMREQKRLKNQGENVPGAPRPGVIVH